MTHHDFFQAMIRDILTTDRGFEIGIVSNDGMVLVSNIADVTAEAHLSAYASIFLDYGNKMISVPSQSNIPPVQVNLSVTTECYIMITRLDERLFLIVKGTDRTKIAPLMKKCLDQIEHITKMNTDITQAGS